MGTERAYQACCCSQVDFLDWRSTAQTWIGVVGAQDGKEPQSERQLRGTLASTARWLLVLSYKLRKVGAELGDVPVAVA